MQFPNKLHVYLLNMPFPSLSSGANVVSSSTLGDIKQLKQDTEFADKLI